MAKFRSAPGVLYKLLLYLAARPERSVTIPHLSEVLGEEQYSLYYHLETLARWGWLERRNQRGKYHPNVYVPTPDFVRLLVTYGER